MTDKEAQQIEQEVSKEAAATAPGIESKIKLGDWIQELKLYGDIRLRGQYDAEQPQIPAAPRQPNYTDSGSKR